jgi:hypothetical protein
MSTATKPATEWVAPEVEVGSIFVCSWGYDQTNVDFYKVVSRTAKSVKIQAWQGASVEDLGPHESMVAGGGPAMVADWSDVPEGTDYWDQRQYVKYVPAPVETKRLKVYGQSGGKYSVALSMTSYSNAYLWDGKPQYQTGYGFGH